MGHLLAPRCGGGWALGIGAYLPPTPEVLWSGEWGPLAPRTHPAWPPANPARGRRELISRLSPRPLPLPLSSPSSLLPSLPPGPKPRARRHAQAGAKPLEAQGGACERGLTSAGPRCPQLLIPPGSWAMELSVPIERLSPGVGALRELGPGRGACCIQAKRRLRSALGGWEMHPDLAGLPRPPADFLFWNLDS